MRDIQRIGDLDAIEHDFDLKRIDVDSSAEAFAPSIIPCLAGHLERNPMSVKRVSQ
jgi:hypothetical protein